MDTVLCAGIEWLITARWLGLVAVRVRTGEFFAGHGRWNEIVMSR